MRQLLVALLVVALGLAGSTCGDDDASGPCSGARLEGTPQLIFGGDRPVEIRLPEDYDPTCPTPLLLVLHGYSTSGAIQSLFFNVDQFVSEERVIVAAPDGTFDDKGNRYWNCEEPEVCCSFWPSDVDDVAYLTDLVDEIVAEYNVDPDRIYVLGHSNGGMMAYRLACDAGEKFAAVVSLAGPSLPDLSDCVAETPSVLHIHGTADDTVAYAGGTNVINGGGGAYPGAEAGVALWAAQLSCDASPVSTGRMDLDGTIDGEETRMERYEGCSDERTVELWTIEGAGHIPSITSHGLPTIWSWLTGHVR